MISPHSRPAEYHHRIPRCLVSLHDRARDSDLDGEGIELWMEYEHEAMRYGVSAEIDRSELVALIEASVVLVLEEDHRNGHSQAGDFARWGRRGGLETLRRYGRVWFSGLARYRWGRITAAELAALRRSTADG